jgi:hypothetical protein
MEGSVVMVLYHAIIFIIVYFFCIFWRVERKYTLLLLFGFYLTFYIARYYFDFLVRSCIVNYNSIV